MIDTHKTSVLISVRVLCLLHHLWVCISPIVSGRCCLLGHPPPLPVTFLPPLLPRSYLGLCAPRSSLSSHGPVGALCSWPLTAKGGSFSRKCWVCVQAYLLDPRNNRPHGRHGDMSYLIFFRFLTFILHFWWLHRKPSWTFLYNIGVDACLLFLAWIACLFNLRVSYSQLQGNGHTRWYLSGLGEVPISILLTVFNLLVF